MALSNRKKQALELDLSGYTGTQIAEEIGCTNATLSKWRNEPEYKEEFEKRMNENIDKATKKLKAYTKIAIEKLVELTQSENERIALTAINSLLDRSLGKARETVSIQADVKQRPLANISDEQLKKMIEDEQ